MASSSSNPASVRGLYTPPAEEWVFLPPTVNPPPSISPPTPSHLPTPFSDTEPDAPLGNDLYGPLKMFAAEYFTTAMAMPFDVGKTLLQVEYRPRRRLVAQDAPEEIEEEKRDWEAEDDTLSNPEEADLYFTDRLSAPSGSFEPKVPANAQADSSGYLPDLHPSWLLKDDPEISRGNGVWGMIRRLRQTPSEGLPSLWKAQLVTTFHSLFFNLLQPQVHLALLSLSPSNPPINPDVPLTALPSPGVPLAIGVSSNLITQIFLSPLELLQTRLIVMPLSHPSTPSSFTLLKQTIKEEGGISGLYLNANLLIPTVLEHTIRPILSLSIPILLERYFDISPQLSPITYSLCDLTLGLASLLVLLPIETVRKRLQLQSRGPEGGKRLKSIVQLRERDYVGVVEAMWRIVTEETGSRRKRIMTEKDEGGVFSGIKQLYRGFGMAATAHLTVFGLGLVSAGLGGSDGGGWQEI